MNKPMPVLILSGITRRYGAGVGEGVGEGGITILNHAHLSIAAGELVALVAPSGAGKSTLLHVAGLLDTPQAGSITIAGQEAASANDGLRTHLRNRHIGFIYQFHHLLPELTAAENIMMPQRIAGVSVADAALRAKALLKRLGIEARGHHYPSQLSGGEQQRVAIARALANKPALILADEPTGNLDPATSDVVADLLLEVAREEGVAALIATHNMALAKRLHRAVTLQQGALIESHIA
jgi:lipoprotein-releasing system ATP-binding protein